MQCEREFGQHLPGPRYHHLGSELGEKILQLQNPHVLPRFCDSHAGKCRPLKMVPNQPYE